MDSPPPVDKLGSLLALARHLQDDFNEITAGSATTYLRKIGADSSKIGNNAAAIRKLEAAISDVGCLRECLQECAAGILEEAGCSFDWCEVGKIERKVKSVEHGLQEILCDVL
jgi:hypothetical protein